MNAADGRGPVDRDVGRLLTRVRTMEDMRRIEGDHDEADLCRDMAAELDRLRTALRRIADHPEPVQAGQLRQIARDGLTPNAELSGAASAVSAGSDS
jgi:hypothetical protein